MSASFLRLSRRFFVRVIGVWAIATFVCVGTAAAELKGGEGSLAVYPSLGSLGPDDIVYLQHQEQLAASYTALAAKSAGPELVLYAYTVRSRLDLFSLAARLNVPYEAIATLNRIDRVRSLEPGERLLVPSMPGLFIPALPTSDLECLISYRGSATAQPLVATGPRGSTAFLFFRGERFNAEERALFLGLLFRFPLPAARVTSGFGLRTSPVSGRTAMHSGIDLAAPAGTEVFAARDGRVSASGTDPVLGEYVIIEHEGDWQTVYGHLSVRYALLNQRVESGMIIGRVGSTGLSTGPHLHFEVRNRGEARNPEPLIPKGKR